MNYIPVSELVTAGHYWWLPMFLADEAHDPTSWTIVSWHPKDPDRIRSGLAYGPLVAPIKAKSPVVIGK